MQHIKCNYDPTWDYPAIARNLFGANKCLVVAEKLATNAHVHFQGFTDLGPREFEKAITDLAATHYSKKVNSASRPVKRAKRTVDEIGFQYLCKEERPPLYSQGFTEDELQALRDASDQHVDELKHALSDYLADRVYDSDPLRAFDDMRMDALQYYIDTDRRIPPRFQKDVLGIMCRHRQATKEWKFFVASRI